VKSLLVEQETLTMTLRKLGLVALIAGAAVLPATAAIAARVVVVRSLGPSAKSYPPGTALSDSSSIKLSNGDMVTLLGPNASRILRGPGVFTASAADRDSLAQAAGRRSRFGALRTGEIAKNPGLWDLDITRGGTVCIAEPTKLKLWRPVADAATTLSIRGDGKTQSVDFAAGQTAANWPAALPVANGNEYEFELDGAGDPAKLSFVTVNSPPTDLVGAAELLIAKGCQNQLDLLVESASKPTTD
jgi:hypothetical protein